MTAKEDFVKAFKKKVGKHPKTFMKNPAKFSAELNKDLPLKKLFREAVIEVAEENGSTAGLSLLFTPPT